MISLIAKPSSGLGKVLLSEIKKEKKGLVVLLTKPFISVSPLIPNKENYIFIDTLGNSSSNIVINVPIKNLTALSIAISEVLESLPEKNRRVLFDSIDSFFTYHSPEVINRFFVFTLSQMRQINADVTIIMSKDSQNAKTILPMLEQSVDKVVK